MDWDKNYAVRYRAKNGRDQWKPTLETLKQCDEDGMGFCLACGASDTLAEPDAVRYECESCGAHKVYGAEELALRGLVA